MSIRRYVELDEAGLTGGDEVYKTSDDKLYRLLDEAELHQAELDLRSFVDEKSCYSMDNTMVQAMLLDDAAEFAGLLQRYSDAKIAHERASKLRES